MGVLLQGFYQQNGKGVPSPNDGDVGAPWWWDYIAHQSNSLRLSGFSAIWMPPITKGKSGIQSIGYDVFDDYDIGAKNQMGTVPTRYGSREQLQRCAAILRANGMDVYLDIVNHQRYGGIFYVYEYLGAGGAANAGRFPKTPGCFHPNVPPDPSTLDTSIFDGDDLSTINSAPAGYVFNGLIAGCDWFVRTLDVQGFRFDDAEGISSNFTLPLATSKAVIGKFIVGELIMSIGDISNWVFSSMQGNAHAFDYPLHYTIAAMCNNPGAFDMTTLDDSGFTASAPLNSVTFVENHDTDSDPKLQPIVMNKMLGYALIMTIEGYPSVYYRDYSTDPNCYGLKPQIDTLIWIHEKLAFGATFQRWKDYNVFAYERLGAPGLLVGLNNYPFSSPTITVATNFGPNVTLHDYTGHSEDVVTDANGNATIALPNNTNGEGYVCYSVAGIASAFDVTSEPVTQEFDGAADLDIMPATNGATVEVGRIWCAAGSSISLSLTVDQTGWSAETIVTVSLVDPTGVTVATLDYTLTAAPNAELTTVAGATGFYSLRIQSANLPTPTAPFTLSATYTAPQLFVAG